MMRLLFLSYSVNVNIIQASIFEITFASAKTAVIHNDKILPP